MSDGFIMPVGSYGDVTVIIGPGGLRALSLGEQLQRLENAMPDLSALVLKMAKGFQEQVVDHLRENDKGPTEAAVEFSVNFSVEGGAPFLQVGAQSGLNVTLSWK